VKRFGRALFGRLQSTLYLEGTFESMVSLLGELEGIFTTAESWVGKAFGAGAPLEAGFSEIKGEGRTVDVARDVKRYGKYKDPKDLKPQDPKIRPQPRPSRPRPPKKPKDPEVLQPDVEMKDPGGGGGPKRKDPSNPEVKVPDADPPPKSFKPGVNYKPGFLGAMAYAARRRGRGRRSVKKYRGKKGSKGRRSVFKRYRTSKARGRRRSYRRKSRLNYRKSGRPVKKLFKKVAALEANTGLKSNLVRYVNYESMALCHRTSALTDAAAVALGLFPFGVKDSGQKILTLQKSLFGCLRYVTASDQARGVFGGYEDPRTITFSKTYTETTIVNQQKHTCNLRLTKLIAKRPVKTTFTYGANTAVAGTINNPDLIAYYNHLYKDHTDPDVADRMKRFLYPEFKSAYAAPVSADWKAVKSMTLKLEPGKSVVIKCKQRDFRCDRQYLNNHAWQKGACTWMIEAWGEMCHIATRAGNQQLLEPIANFNVTSQGADGLFLPGDVSLDVMTKYHTCVSYEVQKPTRNFHVNVPTAVGALSQMGIDMYQDIADDN